MSRTPAHGPAAAWPAALAALATAVLALVLAPLSGSEAAGAIGRASLSTTCHQRPERSFAPGGVPLAACARCTGLHAGVLAGALPALVCGRRLMRRSSALGRAAAVSAGLMALDVAVGILAPGWWDLPVLRALVGLVVAGLVTAWGLTALRSAGAPAAPHGAWA